MIYDEFAKMPESAQRKEYDEMRARVAELEKDKRRLDFISRRHKPSAASVGPITSIWPSLWSSDLRDRIDAAIDGEE